MAVTEDLHALDKWAGALLAQLAPAARRKVMLDVARDLRRSQQARIAAQQNPDGTAYVPRKKKGGKNLRGKRGRIKRATMFTKLRTARYLRTEATPEGLEIGFAGRVARIARIHQLGERAPVEPGGAQAQYPARVLLGFTDAERELIRDKLIAHVTLG
ncbi:phage virion morphogenesis protein [Paraburkholderia oxyphila]|uniref:phage virion morphogenesis protein n=1 Tax=Paraburkholderia oxyphila TaxID=614212 RepID=UPI0004848A3B|nr:phage virion morphogenesis protein [Paraburkholderia oxyphila]